MLKQSNEVLTSQDIWRVVRRFLGYARPYTRFFIGSVIASLLMNTATMAQPYLLKLLTDHVLVGRDYNFLNVICVGLIASAVFKGVFSYLQGYLMAFASQGTMKSIRQTVYQHLQALPMSFWDRSRVGDILSRFTIDIISVTDLLTLGLSNMMNDVIVLVFAIGYMLVKSPGLTALALVASPLIGLAMSRFGRLINTFSSRVQNRMSDLSSHIQETLSSMKVVKSFTREEHEAARFSRTNEETFGTAVKIAQLSVTQTPVVEFLGTLGVVIVVWYGGLGIIRGEFTLGDMMAFWAYMVLATNPLNRLTNTYASLRRGMVCGQRVFEILDLPVEAKDVPGAKDLNSIRGEIEFENVSFSYDSEPILKGLSFKVSPGEMVAVVGPNGAGKTTIVNLIPRFYEPQSGTIRIDGQDITQVKLVSLRKQIGIVLQENILFSGTLRDNIAYGNLDASMEEIEHAAREANAFTFISELPEGFNTRIGERGAGLSGGQRQRIAIARAMLRNPRVLILDEATSSLDQQAESELQEALERIMVGRTSFVIAHRLNTIRRADRILVIEQGRVVEQGKHDDLMAKGGLYRRLYEAQKTNGSALRAQETATVPLEAQPEKN